MDSIVPLAAAVAADAFPLVIGFEVALTSKEIISSASLTSKLLMISTLLEPSSIE